MLSPERSPQPTTLSPDSEGDTPMRTTGQKLAALELKENASPSFHLEPPKPVLHGTSGRNAGLVASNHETFVFSP